MRCTSAYNTYCHVGHIAQQNQLGLFQDSGISVYLEDVKSISCETLCVFGSDTVVPRKLDVQEADMCFHTAQPKLKIFLFMQDCECMEFPRLIFGIW